MTKDRIRRCYSLIALAFPLAALPMLAAANTGDHRNPAADVAHVGTAPGIILYAQAEHVSENGEAPSNDIAGQTPSRQLGEPQDGGLVREIQNLLRQRGFDVGPVDGIMGPATAKAIEAFQKSAGLPANGKPSPEFLDLLKEPLKSEPAGIPESITPPPPSQTSVPVESEPTSRMPSGVSLQGTTWRFTDEAGSNFVLDFAPNGVIKGVIYGDFWSWRQNSEEVEINYDNRMGRTVSRTGSMSSAVAMSGRAITSRGEEWSWSAERLFPPPPKTSPSAGEPRLNEEPVPVNREMEPAASPEAGPRAEQPEQEREPTPDAQEMEPAPTSQQAEPVTTGPANSSEPETEEQPGQPMDDVAENPPPQPDTSQEIVTRDETAPTEMEPSKAPDELPPESPVPGPAVDDPSLSSHNADENERGPQVYGEEGVDSRTVIRATADSWLEVTDADGKIIFSRVLRNGDSYRAPAIQGATFVTGNAGGLEVFVDGQLMPSLGPVGKVRRGVALDPELLKAGATSSPSGSTDKSDQ